MLFSQLTTATALAKAGFPDFRIFFIFFYCEAMFLSFVFMRSRLELIGNLFNFHNIYIYKCRFVNKNTQVENGAIKAAFKFCVFLRTF